jgi:hypothetical protein
MSLFEYIRVGAKFMKLFKEDASYKTLRTSELTNNPAEIRMLCLMNKCLQPTDHELIPARNASLAAMQVSASESNIRYYPTQKYSPLKGRN